MNKEIDFVKKNGTINLSIDKEDVDLADTIIRIVKNP
jgi:hypothetical protein